MLIFIKFEQQYRYTTNYLVPQIVASVPNLLSPVGGNVTLYFSSQPRNLSIVNVMLGNVSCTSQAFNLDLNTLTFTAPPGNQTNLSFVVILSDGSFYNYTLSYLIVTGAVPTSMPTTGGVLTFTYNGQPSNTQTISVTVGNYICSNAVTVGAGLTATTSCSLGAGVSQNLPVVITLGGGLVVTYTYSYMPPTITNVVWDIFPVLGYMSVIAQGTNLGPSEAYVGAYKGDEVSGVIMVSPHTQVYATFNSSGILGDEILWTVGNQQFLWAAVQAQRLWYTSNGDGTGYCSTNDQAFGDCNPAEYIDYQAGCRGDVQTAIFSDFQSVTILPTPDGYYSITSAACRASLVQESTSSNVSWADYSNVGASRWKISNNNIQNSRTITNVYTNLAMVGVYLNSPLSRGKRYDVKICLSSCLQTH